jgi:hypothetical protein
MVGSIESIGDVVTGGIAARAVEPHAGEAQRHGETCLNCGTDLIGDYCHSCGQQGHVHRTLAAFAHDLLHGVLHLEGKIWHTLPKLMYRPGELTRRYIAGERARFVSPLAIFLFSVFLMFAVMSFLGSPENVFGGDSQEVIQAELGEEAAALDGRIEQMKRRRDRGIARGAEMAALEEQIRDAEQAREVMTRLAGKKPASDEAREAGALKRAAEDPGSSLNKAFEAAKKNPKLLAYKLQTNAYKFSWLLIIISVPFVALLFLWRWRPLYDHTVFVTYSISAVSILATISTLLVLAGVPPGPVWLFATLFVPWHMYRQLRGGYELRRFSAWWRMFLLLMFASIALSLFATILVALGLLG